MVEVGVEGRVCLDFRNDGVCIAFVGPAAIEKTKKNQKKFRCSSRRKETNTKYLPAWKTNVWGGFSFSGDVISAVRPNPCCCWPRKGLDLGVVVDFLLPTPNVNVGAGLLGESIPVDDAFLSNASLNDARVPTLGGVVSGPKTISKKMLFD